MKFEKKLVAMCAVFAMGMAACEVDEEESDTDGGTGGMPVGGAPVGGVEPPVGGDAPPQPPADPELSAVWTATNVTVTLHTSAENGPYQLGLAETGNGANGWKGEDCTGENACHPIPANGVLTLTDVAMISEVMPGSTTLLAEGMSAGVTYVVIRDTAEDQGCWTWGHNPQYYKDALGCNDAVQYEPPAPPAGGAPGQ
jgi:hypothetical protein